MQASVAVVLVNFNGAVHTLACIRSLQTLYPLVPQIIVVDNASQPDDREQLWALGEEITLISLDENRGFAAGCNVGLQHAFDDLGVAYVWLLNNDATVEPSALTALLETASKDPYALVGSRLCYPDGRFQRVGNRVNLWTGKLKDEPDPVLSGLVDPLVESLSGASMLISREAYTVLGLWDESYFLYWEDNDYCFKARQAGFTCRVSSASTVYHAEGATTGRHQARVAYYYQRNRLRFLSRWASPLQQLVANAYTRFRLFRSKMKASVPQRRAEAEAFEKAVADFKQGVTGRCPHDI